MSRIGCAFLAAMLGACVSSETAKLPRTRTPARAETRAEPTWKREESWTQPRAVAIDAAGRIAVVGHGCPTTRTWIAPSPARSSSPDLSTARRGSPRRARTTTSTRPGCPASTLRSSRRRREPPTEWLGDSVECDETRCTVSSERFMEGGAPHGHEATLHFERGRDGELYVDRVTVTRWFDRDR